MSRFGIEAGDRVYVTDPALRAMREIIRVGGRIVNPLTLLRRLQPESLKQEMAMVPHGAACVPGSDQCFCSKAPEWQHGVRAVRELKLVPIQPVWSSAVPETPGLYLIRQAGAHRNTWRVVDVGRDKLGNWLASWDHFGPVRVSELKDWQFCRVAEPVEA